MSENFIPQKGPQTLFQTGALGPGSTLWIMPQGHESDWKKKLDWYLNFLISKTESHKPVQVTPEFISFLQEYNMELRAHNKTSTLRMISCEKFLPCKMIVIVPIYDNDFQKWVESIFEVWKKLLKPNFRIFLPVNFPIVDFMSLWPDKNLTADITLVPNQKQAHII